MLVRCNKYKAKFCRGSSCEHYYPHEFKDGDDIWNVNCSDGVCENPEGKFHAVKCIEWIKNDKEVN